MRTGRLPRFERPQEIDLERAVARAVDTRTRHFHKVFAGDKFLGLDLVRTVEHYLGTVFRAGRGTEEQAVPPAIHEHVLSLLLIGFGENGRAIVVQNPDCSVVLVLALVLSLDAERAALHPALVVCYSPDARSRAGAGGWG
jgi:hypothetical protein